MSTQSQTPGEFRTDNQGRLVPVGNIKQIDLTRDQLVHDVAKRAKEHHEALKALKAAVMADINAFVELSAEQYDVKLGGKKGNVTLYSFDGRYKVILAVGEFLAFDERLVAAKSLIDECMTEWSEGSRPELKTLIFDAFAVNKAGKINTHRILSLNKLDISHPKWEQAMAAISESVTVVDSKTYFRVYERNAAGGYDPITLDIAAI